MSRRNTNVLKPFSTQADEFFRGITRVQSDFDETSWQEFKKFFTLMGEATKSEAEVWRNHGSLIVQFKVHMAGYTSSLADLNREVKSVSSFVRKTMIESNLWPIIPARKIELNFSENGGLFIRYEVRTAHLTRFPHLLSWSTRRSIEAARANVLGLTCSRKEITCIWNCMRAYQKKLIDANQKLAHSIIR